MVKLWVSKQKHIRGKFNLKFAFFRACEKIYGRANQHRHHNLPDDTATRIPDREHYTIQQLDTDELLAVFMTKYPQYKPLIQLRLSGCSYKKTAQILGIARKTVHRLKDELKELLQIYLKGDK